MLEFITSELFKSMALGSFAYYVIGWFFRDKKDVRKLAKSSFDEAQENATPLKEYDKYSKDHLLYIWEHNLICGMATMLSPLIRSDFGMGAIGLSLGISLAYSFADDLFVTRRKWNAWANQAIRIGLVAAFCIASAFLIG